MLAMAASSMPRFAIVSGSPARIQVIYVTLPTNFSRFRPTWRDGRAHAIRWIDGARRAPPAALRHKRFDRSRERRVAVRFGRKPRKRIVAKRSAERSRSKATPIQCDLMYCRIVLRNRLTRPI